MTASELNYNDNRTPDRSKLNEYEIKDNLILGDFIKPFETRSMERGLLGGDSEFQTHYPIWFHYENERNLILWKNGLSLAEHEQCHIWLNPLFLTEKWIEKSQSEQGREYYALLHALFEQSLPHIHALSLVQTEMISCRYSLELNLI